MTEALQTGRIVILDEATASRIAAGEVVERPASVLKELIENAIDAGATRIEVEWEAAGTRMMRVSDNGSGMSPAEAVASLQRHATSKIRSADDLETLTTLGFRGEALPSIASVSHFRIVTRTEGDVAAEVLVAGGVVEDVLEAVREPGTDVWVHNLFYNQPARAKFLKSVTTEHASCLETVSRMALAHGHVAFRAIADGREVLQTSGSGRAEETVAEVLGAAVAREMVPVHGVNEDVIVHGFVSRPTLTRPTRGGQHFWVNRHPVSNRVLLHGFDAGYRAVLPTDRHPWCVLFVEIPPRSVDINVHPRKADVRFRREQTVHSAVYHAVRDGLLSANLKPGFDLEPLMPAPGTGEPFPLLPLPPQERPAFLPPEPGPGASAPLSAVEPAAPLAPDAADPFVSGEDAADVAPPAAAPRGGSTFRVLGQIQNTFIVVEGERGLMLVDQHVAHERVLYEELGRQMAAGEAERQHLLIPLSVKLDAGEMASFDNNREALARAGFEIEAFGPDDVLIRSVPALLAARFHERSFRDLLHDLAEGGTVGQRNDIREHILSTAACKASVKAGDPLEPEEMTGLMEALFRTSNPYLCPHGRPIILHLSVDELLKRFGRA